MKTIGIIGGLAWPSTITYYHNINRSISEKLGPRHCAELILVQTDGDFVMQCAEDKEWDTITALLVSLAKKLEAGGADFIVIACNTVHKVVPAIENQTQLPILHIVDAVCARVREHGLHRVALLGTRTTMTDGFFTERLAQNQIETLLPSEDDQSMIHHALHTELAPGMFLPETRLRFSRVIERLVQRGAQAVILGCTEFGRLVKAEDCSVLLIDTVDVHSEMAVDMLLR